MASWRGANRLRLLIYHRERHHEERLAVLWFYSDGSLRCACPPCGEDRYEFLTLDHVDGGGNAHRKGINRGEREWGGGGLMRWLLNHDYPPGFQVLCWNCNAGKAFYGVCPHLGGET